MSFITSIIATIAATAAADYSLGSGVDLEEISMPGSWPVFTQPADIIVSAAWSAASLKRALTRSFVLSFSLLLVWSILFVLSGLVFLVPWMIASVIWWNLGPVFCLNLFWSLVLGFSVFLSATSLLVTTLWLSVMKIVGEFMMALPQTRKQIRVSLKTMRGLIEHRPHVTPIKLQGVTYVRQTILDTEKVDEPLAFALYTAVIYLPDVNPSWFSLVFSLAILVLALAKNLYAAVYRFVRASFFTFKVSLTLVVLALCGSDSLIEAWSGIVYHIVNLSFYPLYWCIRRGSFKASRAYLRVSLLYLTLRLLNLALAVGLLTVGQAPSGTGWGFKKQRLRSYWNNAIISFNRYVDKIAVPNFIRTMPDFFDSDSINETNEILASLGWPSAPRVERLDKPDANPKNLYKYLDSYLGETSIRQGILRMDLEVAPELHRLAGLASEYKRAEQYATAESELESLSRYFEEPTIELPDLHVDDVWVLVREIFQNSRLTPFSYIIKKWEKKYGLGPFWGDPDSKTRWKKLSRKKFIKSLGGIPQFIKLWAKTFEVSTGLIPVAPVSVKSEALPEKKWRNDIVRTVIGSPITHYISSTLWNFFPNHNFKFWSTNIKVGMPLNGANISRLILEHSAYNHHFAGDFTGFDATVAEAISRLIAKVRKKGFERHRDYAKICFLIDANYHNLLRMPLMTTSTGKIYTKRTGLSTGHSSTSADNSLAVTVLYIAAWKKVTGLSAHEFRHFCKLSNYGDDHILSWTASCPAAWNSNNIIAMMSSFGVQLRDEEPSHNLLNMSFLSKEWRKPTWSDLAEMSKAGVSSKGLIVFHSASKLVGKAYAPSKDKRVDRNYRLKRLISYLYLTAHHKDVYDKILASIDEVAIAKSGLRLRMPAPVPTYDEVLSRWYDPASVIKEEDDRTEEDTPLEGHIMDYSMDGLLDTVVNVLAVIPDFVNPAIYNAGYTRHLVSLFAKHLSWPVHLVNRSNVVVTQAETVSILRRTPYEFIADAPTALAMPSDFSNGGLLLKHWLFMLFFSTPNPNALAAMLMWADKKVADLNFLFNANVQTTVRRYDVPWLRLCYCALLDFVPDINLPGFLMHVSVPSLSYFVEYIFGFIVNTAWSKVPPNMKVATRLIDLMPATAKRLLVVAPTGSGKSTALVASIYQSQWHRFERIVLVVPRRLLVHSLGDYLAGAFGLPISKVTEGHPYLNEMRFIITTPMEVLLHSQWLKGDTLFLWDECHLDEPDYLALGRLFLRLNIAVVATTATPSANNYEWCQMTAPLTIASTWTIDDVMGEKVTEPIMTLHDYWADYRGRTLGIVRAFPLMKFLIFVTDKNHAHNLAALCAGKVCVLTSDSREIDPKARIFICTPVADVGLTIPDVNWVITSNVARFSQSSSGKENLVVAKLSPLTMKQRRGRTGRTSNGLFTMIEYTNCDFFREPILWNDVTVGAHVLMQGAPPDLVLKHFKESVVSLWQEDPQASVLTHFSGHMEQFQRVLRTMLQRNFQPTIEGDDMLDYFTTHANTLPLNKTQKGTRYDPEPAKVSDINMFIIGVSKWMADHRLTLDDTELLHYFRSSLLSFRDFTNLWEQGNFIGSGYSERAMRDVDEAGRFGKRTTAGSEVQDQPLEGAPFFDGTTI